MSYELSIVILNYKNWKDTIDCLASLFDVTYDSYQTIVVDNDSQNGSLEEITKWLIARQIQPLHLSQEQSERGNFKDNPVVLIQSDTNHGYAAGNNIGIRRAIQAGSSYVMILNNDTIVKKDFIEPLVSFMNNDSDIAMTGPKILDSNGNIDRTSARRRPKISGYFFRFGIMNILFPNNRWIREYYYSGEYDYDAPKEVDVLSGACLLMRAEIIKRMDYMDDGTFLFFEEFILCEKIRMQHKKAFVIPASKIMHKKGSSIENDQSTFILDKSVESFRYYLTEYRRLPVFLASLIMFYVYPRYHFRKWKVLLRNK